MTMGNSVNRLLLSIGVLIVPLLAGCHNPETLTHRAELALRRGDLAEAQRNLEEAESMRPADFRIQFLLGKLRLEQDRPIDAQVAFQRARTIHGDGPLRTDVMDLVAESLYRQGEPARDRLVAYLREAANEYRTMQDYLRQGRYLTKIGDPDNAIVALRKAESVSDGQSVEPYEALAEFYMALNDREQALKYSRYVYHFDADNADNNARLRSLGMVPGPTVALAPPVSG